MKSRQKENADLDFLSWPAAAFVLALFSTMAAAQEATKLIRLLDTRAQLTALTMMWKSLWATIF
jgi:hypothetical protein